MRIGDFTGPVRPVTTDRRNCRYAGGSQSIGVDYRDNWPAILLVTDGGPQVTSGLSFYQLLAYNLRIASGVLTLRVLTSMLSSTNGS